MENVDIQIEKLLNDKNIVKIMHKASNRFSNQLDKDEIYTCQINALWKSILNFKPDKNAKFTTYLYNGVFIECLKSIKFHKKHSKFCTKKLHNNLSKKDNSELLIDILDEANDDDERQFIIDKYSNMTINEMAEKRNSNRETTRKKMKKLFNTIQKNCKEVY